MTTELASDCPRVSVIIPVRNGKEFIQEAIESVLCQSFTSFEIIVIDDGSEDFDYKILELQDKRIRVEQQEGRGVSHARNTGMRLARGDFFAFLDADDAWLPGKLSAQIRYFDNHPNVGVVFGKYIKWLPNGDGEFATAASLGSDCGHLDTPDIERSGWIYTRLLMGLLVGMNTAIIRRIVYRQIGEFNEAMRIGEDYDFWLRASRIAEMHSLDGVVALYRIHPASAMHRINRENHMARLLLCADARWGITNPDQTTLDRNDFRVRVAMMHFTHGYSHYWHGDPVIARHSFVRAFIGGGRRARSSVYLMLASLTALAQWARRGLIGRKTSSEQGPLSRSASIK